MIELQKLTKTFTGAGGTVEALRDIDLTIPDGEIYGIIGMSGAGKSTLVRCINMLERPTSGKVVIDGRDMAALPPEELRRARRLTRLNILSSTLGCMRLKRSREGRSRYLETVSPTPMRSSPPSRVFTFPSSACPCSISERADPTYSNNIRPSWVSSTPRLPLIKRAAPTASSRALTDWLTALCVRKSSSAPAVKLLLTATR